MIFILYRLLLTPAAPVLRLMLQRRQKRGKEDALRLPERWGQASLPRPSGPLLWLHAASVGESVSLLALIARLQHERPDVHLLLTTGTVTSAKLMTARLPAGVIHQFVPVDHPSWVARFLDHWQPDAVLWSESELWPNLLGAVRRRAIPAMLVNARMSEGSYRRWRRVRGFAAQTLAVFTRCLAQTEIEAERLRDLGARDVQVAGNLKYAAEPLPDHAAARAALSTIIAGRPVVLWASTHAGEEAIAAGLYRRLRDQVPDLLTIIVPRHPARGEELARELAGDDLRITRRSQGEMPDSGTGIYLADTLGELGLFYRLCPTVVMGGTFVDVGGHNLIEPGQLGQVIICGPYLYNFAQVREDFVAARALLEVPDPASLGDVLLARLQNPDAYDAIGKAAAAWTAQQAGVIDRIYAAIKPLLPIQRGTR